MKFLALLIVSMIGFGCGGSSSNGSAFNGSVSGKNLSPHNAVYLSVDDTSTNPAVHNVTLIISDAADICGDLKANVARKNATTFKAVLATSSGQPSNTLGPATYNVYNSNTGTVPSGNYAIPSFGKNDDNCNSAFSGQQSLYGTSGSITVSSLSISSGSDAVGNFDVYIGPDHVTGNFTAKPCDYRASGVGQNRLCQ